MRKLAVSDLWKLEDYAERRLAFRAQVIQHKKARTLHIGPNLTLLFEDRLTIQYQVQEMLRIERIYEKAGIQDELAAYNPLIPDGSNWKATCLIEYEDVAERQHALVALKGVEHQIWTQVGEWPRTVAVADEDLERANEEKTSAVHFLRFDLDAPAISALQEGAPLRFGVAHPAYDHEQTADAALRRSLLGDLT